MKNFTVEQVIENTSRRSFNIPATFLAVDSPCAASRWAPKTLEGQNKGNTTLWSTGNLQGWAELDYIPMRVSFARFNRFAHRHA
jgi:hypothetical protein